MKKIKKKLTKEEAFELKIEKWKKESKERLKDAGHKKHTAHEEIMDKIIKNTKKNERNNDNEYTR